jgi:hypothetical protein
MANSMLESLLAPYRAAVAGEDPDYENDPLYASLASTAAVRGGGGGGGASAPGGLSGLKALAAQLAAKRYGWSGDQWDALQELVQRESSWDPQADNPTSTAHGLFQFLESTRNNYGIGLNASPKAQIAAGLRYIQDRYGSPSKALAFHDRENYY